MPHASGKATIACQHASSRGSAVLAAVEQTLAMIEFDTQGRVLWANGNFARAMGYEASELPGLLHRQFCTAEYVNSPDYAALWAQLRSGRAFQEKILRVSKDPLVRGDIYSRI